LGLVSGPPQGVANLNQCVEDFKTNFILSNQSEKQPNAWVWPVGLNRRLALVTTPLIFTRDSIPVAVHFCSRTIPDVEGGFFT
jgi:hypothetical protein